MNRTLIFLALLFLVAMCSPAALSDTTLRQTYADAGKKAYGQGQYIEAQRMYEACLKECEGLQSQTAFLAATLVDIANCHYALGKYLEAEPLLKRALSIYEKSPASEQSGNLQCLNNLAAVYCAEAKYAEAEPLFERVLSTYDKSGTADTISAAAVHNNLGNLCQTQGRFTDAQKHYSKALAIYEKSKDCEGDVAMTASNLGLLDLRQGKLSSAEPLLNRALDIREKLLIPTHPDLATSINMIGLLYFAQGKYADAETNYKKAQELWENSLGAEHADVALCLNNIGDCAYALARYSDAESFYKKALAIREKSLGLQHPDVAASLSSLGRLYCRQAKYADAEAQYKRAIEITQKALSASSPDMVLCLTGLANCYLAEDKLSQADQLFKRAADSQVGLTAGNSVTRAHGTTAGSQPLAASRPAGNADRPIQDKWALVVGISKFKDPKMNLQYASKDAMDFYNYLIKDGHFAQDHVKLLLDERATRENILAYIGDRWLPRAAGPDDLVLIYISTHGSASQMDLSGVNYVIAYDTNPDSLYATGIPIKDLNSMVKDRVHCDRVVLILDACHSGAAASASKGLNRALNYDAEQIVQGTGQLVLCSSEPNQVSWESKNYQNGVFTHQLIDAFRTRGPNTDLGSIFDLMRKQVQQEVLRDRGELQSPVLVSKWEGRALVLCSPPANPRPGLSEPVPPRAAPVASKAASQAKSPAQLKNGKNR